MARLPAAVRTVVLDECHHLASMWGYVVRGADVPRYLVSRLVPGDGIVRPLTRVLRRRPPFERGWVGVPADLGRNPKRAEAYWRGRQHWLGPAELQETQDPEAGQGAAAHQQADYTTSTRTVWA